LPEGGDIPLDSCSTFQANGITATDVTMDPGEPHLLEPLVYLRCSGLPFPDRRNKRLSALVNG
jgi:hypothetical protein